MLLSVLIDGLTLFAWLFLGIVVVRAASPRSPGVLQWALAFPVSAALYTWFLFVVSWAGVPLTASSLILVYLVLLSAAGYFLWRQHRRQADWAASVAQPTAPAGPSRFEWASFGVVGLTFLLAGIISVGRSYSSFDAAAIWAPKGYGIALEHSVFGGAKGGHGLSYPLNIPLLIASFRLLSGDPLPSSKLIFPLFNLSLTLGVIALWRWLKVDRRFLLAGVLLLATVPVLFEYSTYGYTNLPLASYLCLGLIAGCMGLEQKEPGLQLLSGILLGAAGWTRLEGSAYAIAVAGCLALGGLVFHPRGYRPALQWLPLLLLSGSWLVFFFLFGASGSQAEGRFLVGLRAILSGDLGLGSLRLILGYFRRYIFRTRLWGWLFPAAALLLALTGPRIVRRRPPTELTLLAATAFTGVLTFLIFYLGSFGSTDLLGWLTRSFPREFFPSAILLGATSIAATRLLWPARDEDINPGQAS